MLIEKDYNLYGGRIVKKSIIFCISILALIFASCKSTPAADDTAEEVVQEQTVEAPGDATASENAEKINPNDIGAVNKAKLEKLEKARKAAIDANAPELLPEPFEAAEKTYNDRKDYVSAHFESESFAEEIDALTTRYQALAEAADAYAKKQRIEELGLAQYDKAGYQKGENAWNKLSDQYEKNASGEELLASAKEVNDAYSKVLKAGLKSIAAKARSAAAAAKKKADSVYAGVSEKAIYKTCSDKIVKADSALVTGDPEKAYKGYKDAEASFLTLYESVSKKRAAAQAKIEEAKEAVAKAQNYAEEADEKAPLAEPVDGIESEDATLLEEEVYSNPEDSVIDVDNTEVGKAAAVIEAEEK